MVTLSCENVSFCVPSAFEAKSISSLSVVCRPVPLWAPGMGASAIRETVNAPEGGWVLAPTLDELLLDAVGADALELLAGIALELEPAGAAVLLEPSDVLGIPGGPDGPAPLGCVLLWPALLLDVVLGPGLVLLAAGTNAELELVPAGTAGRVGLLMSGTVVVAAELDAGPTDGDVGASTTDDGSGATGTHPPPNNGAGQGAYGG